MLDNLQPGFQVVQHYYVPDSQIEYHIDADLQSTKPLTIILYLNRYDGGVKSKTIAFVTVTSDTTADQMAEIVAHFKENWVASEGHVLGVPKPPPNADKLLEKMILTITMRKNPTDNTLDIILNPVAAQQAVPGSGAV